MVHFQELNSDELAAIPCLGHPLMLQAHGNEGALAGTGVSLEILEVSF